MSITWASSWTATLVPSGFLKPNRTCLRDSSTGPCMWTMPAMSWWSPGSKSALKLVTWTMMSRCVGHSQSGRPCPSIAAAAAIRTRMSSGTGDCCGPTMRCSARNIATSASKRARPAGASRL